MPAKCDEKDRVSDLNCPSAPTEMTIIATATSNHSIAEALFLTLKFDLTAFILKTSFSKFISAVPCPTNKSSMRNQAKIGQIAETIMSWHKIPKE
ncbi:MAG: hypothetical protein EBY35_03490 [Rhodobacteraceae bacterium]|nr:hypothetical protein [Paracoccaceae bacterium]NDH25277.1 hypothetical protein [Paracoccaceae bacterium]